MYGNTRPKYGWRAQVQLLPFLMQESARGLRFGGSGWMKSEAKCRSRPRRRLHPYPAAMPLDSLLAECQSKPVPGVVFSVQALKRPEYSSLECRVYAGAIVLHRKYPIGIHPAARNVNSRSRRVAVFDGIPNQMVQDLGKYGEVSAHRRQGIMGNDCAPFR